MTLHILRGALSPLTQSFSAQVVRGPVFRFSIGPSCLPQTPPRVPASHPLASMLGSPAHGAGAQGRPIFTRVDQRVTEGRVLYHGTSERRAASIRDEGFDPSRTGETTPRGYSRAGIGVYLTTNKDVAAHWGAQADRPRPPSVWDDEPPQQSQTQATVMQGEPRVSVIEVYPPDKNPDYRRIVVPWDRRGDPSEASGYIREHPGTHEAVVASAPNPDDEEEVLLTAHAAKDANVEILYWVPPLVRDEGEGEGPTGETTA